MPISCGKKFLYSRIVIIIATVGWMLFLYAGVRGFSLWHGGFAVFFWLAFGLLNYPEHSPLWLAFHRANKFLFLYGAFVFVAILVDQFGLGARLWFYPEYQSWWILLAYGVAYPFGGLSVIELPHFLARLWGEPLTFEKSFLTPRRFFDVFEQTLLFFILAVILAGVAGIANGLSVPLAAVPVIVWVIAAFIKLRLHIRHHGHYTLIIALAVALAALLHEFPQLAMREWIYLSAPFADFFSVLAFGVPVWQWMSSFFFVLVPLRLWLVFAR